MMRLCPSCSGRSGRRHRQTNRKRLVCQYIHDDCGRPPTLLEIAVGIEERGERHGHDFTLAGFTPDGHSALLTCAECDLGLTVSQNHRGGWTVVDDDGHDGFNLIDVRCTR